MGFTEQEAFESMASALEARGLASPETIQADRATQPFYKPAEQAVTTTDTTNLEAGQVDPAAAQLDQSIFAGPASPDGYRFIAPPNGVSHNAAQEQPIRAAFHEIGLPTSIAAQADRLWNQSLQERPTAEQLESSRQQGYAQLTRTFGADTARVVSIAQAEFARMTSKAPQLRDMAEQSGIGNNPMLIASLYHNAKAKGRA